MRSYTRTGRWFQASAPALTLGILLLAMLSAHAVMLMGAALATVLWLAVLVFDEKRTRLHPKVALHPAWLLVPVLAAVAWANAPALSGDFVTDDFGCLRLWHGKSAAGIVQLGDISDGIWGAPDDELRPVFALWYKGLLSAFGAQPRPLHAANLLLHLLTCLVVYGIARQWWAPKGDAAGVAAALLFGMMPVNAEPVAWLIGGVDVLAALFYLVVVLLFVRFRATGRRGAWVAAIATSVPAFFTKEIVVTLPAALLAFDLLVARPYAWSRGRRAEALVRLAGVHAPFILAGAGFLMLRRLAFDTFAREGRLIERLPWFVASLPTRLRWFLLPESTDGTWRLTVAVIAMGGLLACLVWLWLRREGHEEASAWIACFGIALPAITHLPLVVTYLSPRHLYLPGAALALAASVALFPGPDPRSDGRPRTTAPRVAILLALLVVFVPALRQGHTAWREAAAISRDARIGIERVTADLPEGAFVVVSGVPAQHGPTLVWRFALPFALQPPFTTRDIASSLRLVETPELHCCPPDHWWRSRAPRIADLLEGDPRARVDLYLVELEGDTVHLRHGRPRRRLVRGLIEETLGRPFTAGTTGSLAEGRGVVDRLADLARRRPRGRRSPRP